MLLRHTVLCGAVGLALACGGLSEGAKKVRVYTKPANVAGCENIGRTNGHASGWNDRDRYDAEHEARENAAEFGADAILITSHSSGFSGHDIEADMYRCKAAAVAAPTPAVPSAPAAPVKRVRLPKPQRIVVIGFRGLEVKDSVVEIFTSMFTAELEQIGNLTVVDRADIEAVLDIEKTKDLVGCKDTSCLAEIAGAMGTSLVSYGSIGKLGDQYAVSAAVFDNSLGTAKARLSKVIELDDATLATIVPEITADLARQLGAQ